MMNVLMVAIGLFSIGLGAWHLGVPAWFHVAAAIDGRTRRPLPPVRMTPFRYGTTRRDVLAVVWIMNLAASYGLISVGVVGLAAPLWIGTPAGRLLALWMAGWWAVRAAAQLAMGVRRIDLVVITGFGGLAAACVLAAIW